MNIPGSTRKKFRFLIFFALAMLLVFSKISSMDALAKSDLFSGIPLHSYTEADYSPDYKSVEFAAIGWEIIEEILREYYPVGDNTNERMVAVVDFLESFLPTATIAFSPKSTTLTLTDSNYLTLDTPAPTFLAGTPTSTSTLPPNAFTPTLNGSFTPTYTLTNTPPPNSTYTPTYTPTSTQLPTNTPPPAPTNTPPPAPTNTPPPAPTNTPPPAPTNTPPPAPTNTPPPAPTDPPSNNDGVEITKAKWDPEDNMATINATWNGSVDSSVSMTASPGGKMSIQEGKYKIKFSISNCPCTIVVSSSEGGSDSATIGP